MVFIALALWIGIAWRSRYGDGGGRGVYVALMVVGLFVSLLFDTGVDGRPDLQQATWVLFNFGVGLLGGGLLGTCLYRPVTSSPKGLPQ